jgi:hypothetical protein
MSVPLTPSLVRVPRLATLVACRALDFAADHRALELLHRVRARLKHRTSARQIESCIPAGLMRAGLESSINDVVIARVGSRPELPTAIVKLARTETATTALLREANAIAALKADPRFRDFPTRLPDVLADGERDGRRYLVETLLPGISAALCSPAVNHAAGSRALLSGRSASFTDEPQGRCRSIVQRSTAGSTARRWPSRESRPPVVAWRFGGSCAGLA